MSEVLMPRWTRFKKPAAVAGSLILHVLMLSALTLSSNSHLSPADLTGEGEAEMAGIEIDLVGLHDSTEPQAALPPSQPQTPANLFAEMTGMAPEPTQNTSLSPSQPQSIAEALGENPFQPQSSPESKTATEAHIKVDNNNSKTANDLWKAIEPCWKRVADKSTVSVTLEVSFSPLGNLSKPPIIKRPSGADLSDRMLRSENQAINALAQCGPYLMAYGQEGVQIQFPSRKG